MVMNTTHSIEKSAANLLLARNEIVEGFFAREAMPLANACRDMSERFLRGGRLLAFGRGAYSSDAQHVSVEFVHPIIVGKRALPALDLSIEFSRWLRSLVRCDDIVMGFGPPEGDPQVQSALDFARERAVMTFALPGTAAAYALTPATSDALIHQELVEILYHTLWETVHVFFEHRELGQDVGAAEFLYPFLGHQKQETGATLSEVAASIEIKARDDSKLRAQVADQECDRIGEAVVAIAERLRCGGKLIFFGNGGSATDANDAALDCVAPPHDWRPIPAISLAMEPANLSAIANDVGVALIFQRQLVAHARPEDVAIGLSTSGGSENIGVALRESRRRGLLTVALLGYDGGAIKRQSLADFPFVVRSDYIPRIQEVQGSILHVLRQLLEERRDGV
jgi:D-sedoheptulose 7-phosphate isomerase